MTLDKLVIKKNSLEKAVEEKKRKKISCIKVVVAEDNSAHCQEIDSDQLKVDSAFHPSKCGNFAVLADFHIASQDRMWFSDHQREEVCLLLKDAVESRIKQYLKTRKLHGRCKQTEHGEANSLSLRADEFHISAYFVKRWANLRYIGQPHSELRVFPDRFVIYVSRFESNPSSWVSESVALEENLFTKVSEYFQGSTEARKCQISLTQQEKQDTLKKLMKRATHTNEKKPQPRTATTKVYLGSLGSDTE